MNAADDRIVGARQVKPVTWALTVSVFTLGVLLATISANGAAINTVPGHNSHAFEAARNRHSGGIHGYFLQKRSSSVVDDSVPDADSNTDSVDSAESSADGAAGATADATAGARVVPDQVVVADPVASPTASPPSLPNVPDVFDSRQALTTPDIIVNPPLLGGTGDIPETPDPRPTDKDGVPAAGRGLPPQVPSVPNLPGPAQNGRCQSPPQCTGTRAMADSVSFAYESLFNILREISVASVSALLQDLGGAKGNSDCADIMSRNATGVGARIKHGRRDATLQITTWPSSNAVPGGMPTPRSAIYTTGVFSGLGQLRNTIRYDKAGKLANGEFSILFPGADKFVTFPVVVEVHDVDNSTC